MQPVTMLEPIIAAAAVASPQNPGDYFHDGLLYCGQCGTPKQCRKNILGREIVVSCLCKCATQNRDAEEAERRKEEEADRIMRLRTAGIAAQAFRNARFDQDDGQNAAPMSTVRRSAARWAACGQTNIGLMLYGGVGTGISFAAACLANDLIGRKIPVCMTNLSGILNALGGIQLEEKSAFIDDLAKYPLLILDDFGMERQTEYALEQVFNVVDTRYRSGKPLIITTNLSLSEMKNPKSRDLARIYDRVLEMCAPVNFGNNGRRSEIASEKMQQAAQILRG